MNTEECKARASECAASAAAAPGEYLTGEFLKLAAQWRAMAVREDFLGEMGQTNGSAAGIKSTANNRP